MLLQTPCEACGADLKFNPGTQSLSCDYCNHHMEIEGADDWGYEAQEEINLADYFHEEEESDGLVERYVAHCQSCGAETELEENQQSSICPFCATPLVVEQAQTLKKIKPKGLLPFYIERKEAVASYREWQDSLWFAPNDLKKRSATHDGFEGVYLPFWTYDADSISYYSGKRGDYYYVTVRTKDSDGNTVSKKERRTKWHYVQGRVCCSFDDILVPASQSLPQDKLEALEPWDLDNLVDYQDAYLAGYRSEIYQTSLQDGFYIAEEVMDDGIREQVRWDIGGDRQVIHSVDTRYTHATFKHILLPVWISSYQYKGKLYQILVNARTGEVQAERPWSWPKITAAILTAIAAFGLAYWAYKINS
ncbi:MAG: hypothetical protein PVF65_12510 [Sphingomonadales bacterium]|jgi:hypothetical protein